MSAPLQDLEFFSYEAFDGTRIAGQRFGHGATPCVLANGLGGNYEAWKPITRAFADDLRFISWDYRGLYDSGKPPHRSDYSMRHHARDMLGAMDRSGVDQALWVGWSMGVQVLLEAYRVAPERCRAMVLLNGTYGRAFHTALNWRHARFALPVVNELGRIAAKPQSRIIKTAVKLGVALPVFKGLGLVSRRIDGEMFNELAQGVSTIDLDVFHRNLAELDRHDASSALRDIEVPVLILAGDRDLMTPHQVTDKMMAEIPHAHLDVVPGASHYMLLEEPQRVISRMRVFLDDHAQARGEAA